MSTSPKIKRPKASFYNIDTLLDQLERTLPPRTYGVQLDRPLSEGFRKGWDQSVQAIQPHVQRLENDGVPTKRIVEILARWHSPLDRDTVQLLITGLADMRKRIQRQIYLRARSAHDLEVLGEIEWLEHTRAVLTTLQQDKKAVVKAEQLLAGVRPLLRGKRNPSVHKAGVNLVRLLRNSGLQRKAAEIEAYELLSSWDATRAPKSYDAFRVGLSKSTR